MKAGNLPDAINVEPQSVVTVENLCPLIESFLGSLTVEEWEKLKTEQFDLSLDFDILELFLNIVVIQSTAMINAVDRSDDSMEQNLSRLESTLRQSIIRALGLPNTVQSRYFTDLFINMKTAVKTYVENDTKGNTGSIPNFTMIEIMGNARNLLRSVLPKTFHTHRTQDRYGLFQKEYNLFTGDIEDDDGSELRSISSAVQKVLIEDMRRFTGHILRDLSNSVLQLLECEIFQCFEHVSNDIVKALVERDTKEVLSKWESFHIDFCTKLWEYRARVQLNCTVLIGYEESKEKMNRCKVMYSTFNMKPTFNMVETECEKTDKDDAFAGKIWVFKSILQTWFFMWTPDRSAKYNMFSLMRRTVGLPSNVEVFYPMIRLFIYRLTADQMIFLETGEPDDATRMTLAELFLEIIIITSTAVREALDRKDDSLSQHILSSMSDTLRLSFSKALNLTYPAHSVDFECFADLVVGEVKAIIKTVNHTGGPMVCQCHHLNSIVDHGTKILKEIYPLRGEDIINTRSYKLLEKENILLDGGTEADGDSKLDSLSTAVQKELIKELRVILDHILPNLSKSSIHLLEEEILNNIKSVSKDIAQAVVTKDMDCVTWKIQSFLTECIAKAWNWQTRQQMQYQPLHIRSVYEEEEKSLLLEMIHVKAKGSMNLTMKTKDCFNLPHQIYTKVWTINSLINWWKYKFYSRSERMALTLIDRLGPPTPTEALRPLVKSFFDRVTTVKLWRYLKLGKLGRAYDATSKMLVELLVDILRSCRAVTTPPDREALCKMIQSTLATFKAAKRYATENAVSQGFLKVISQIPNVVSQLYHKLKFKMFNMGLVTANPDRQM